MNSIIFGDRFVSVSDSLYITVVSMAIVFSVLVLICLFVSCMKYIPQEKQEKKEGKKATGKANSVAPKVVATPREEKKEMIHYEDENVRLAIMVASMEAAAEDENACIKIRSVREIV